MKKIEQKIEATFPTCDVRRGIILVDEQEIEAMDQMLQAIIDGNLKRIYEIETLGIDVTQNFLVKFAIKHEQLLVVCHQVHKGANIDTVIGYSEDYEIGTIWQWAKSWRKLHFTPKSNNQPKETIWNEKN